MKTLAHFKDEMHDLSMADHMEPPKKREYNELLNQLVHKKVQKASTPSSNMNSAARARHLRASVDETAPLNLTHRAKPSTGLAADVQLSAKLNSHRMQIIKSPREPRLQTLE